MPPPHSASVNIFTTLAASTAPHVHDEVSSSTAAATAVVDNDALLPPVHADTEAWLRMRVAVNDLLALVAAALLERTGDLISTPYPQQCYPD